MQKINAERKPPKTIKRCAELEKMNFFCGLITDFLIASDTSILKRRRRKMIWSRTTLATIIISFFDVTIFKPL